MVILEGDSQYCGHDLLSRYLLAAEISLSIQSENENDDGGNVQKCPHAGRHAV